MKVIGKTEHGWLVEASDYELQELAGNDTRERRVVHHLERHNIRIGTKFDVHKMYATLQRLRGNADIRNAADRLVSLSKLILNDEKFIESLDPDNQTTTENDPE